MKLSLHRTVVILIMISVVGLSLRLPGLWWGTNLFGDGQHYVLEPDELHHTTIAEQFLRGKEFDYFYARGLADQIAVVFSIWRSVFPRTALNTHNLNFIGRLLSLFYGLSMIWLLYFVARELFRDDTISLLASLFLSLSWIHVAYSHIGVSDSSALFWTYLAFYFVLKYINEKDDAHLFFASVGAGFSFGTKFNMILLFPLLVIVFSSKRRLYHTLLVFFTFIGSFELINMFSYTPKSFLETIHVTRTDSFSGVEMNRLINVPVYFLLLLPSSGLPVLILSIWGIFKLTKTIDWRTIDPKTSFTNRYFIILFPLALYFYTISMLVVNFNRYLMPMIPLLAVFAAFGLTQLIDRLSRPRIFRGILAAIILYQLVQIISLEKATIFDSRKLMGEWMKKNLSSVDVVSTGPQNLFNRVPSVYTINNNLNADYIVLHSCFYSRYLTGGYGFKNSYPESCEKIYHCMGGEDVRKFIQDLFLGKTEYQMEKKFEMNFVTPEMLLMKYIFGPRVDGYGSYTGDTVIFGRP